MKPRRGKTETGSVVVEGALILLLMFIFLLGLMEAGHLFLVQQTLTDAAREGARLGVAPLTQTSTLASDADIRTKVRIFLASAGVIVQDANIVITHPIVSVNSVDTAFTRVSVRTSYQPFLVLLGLNNLALKGEAMMRNETSD